MYTFTTIVRTPQLLDLLLEELDMARTKVAGDTRWLNALDAAQDHIHFAETFQWDAKHQAVKVESASEAGKSYIANGACQCKAYTASGEHQACWHRALGRVLRNALARQLPPAPLPFEPQPVKRPMSRAERAVALAEMAELFA